MMTSEKAIQLLHRLQDEQFDGIHGDERREALVMAVRALEPNLGQKTIDCIIKRLDGEDNTAGDTIYRQDAIDALAKWLYDVFGIKESDGTATIFKRLRELPSAQPQCRTGRWIRKTDTRFGEMLNDILICSECGIAFSTLNMIRRSYCPSCGADMRGESDE